MDAMPDTNSICDVSFCYCFKRRESEFKFLQKALLQDFRFSKGKNTRICPKQVGEGDANKSFIDGMSLQPFNINPVIKIDTGTFNVPIITGIYFSGVIQCNGRNK